MDGKVRRKNKQMERAGKEGCRCGNENERIRRESEGDTHAVMEIPGGSDLFVR